jgi:hypothetical protein
MSHESHLKETVTVIVSGVPTEVTVNERTPLRELIPHALQQTGNTGRPPQDWEFTDASGLLLDPDQNFGKFRFPEDVKLFLNLKAGIAGL